MQGATRKEKVGAMADQQENCFKKD